VRAPLYIQEKVHPKAIIDDLKRRTKEREARGDGQIIADLFADFNGIPKGAEQDGRSSTSIDQHWSNRMILGDSPAGDGEPGRTREPEAARCSASISTRPMASSSIQQLAVELHPVSRGK
jgi:hypothetical protein